VTLSVRDVDVPKDKHVKLINLKKVIFGIILAYAIYTNTSETIHNPTEHDITVL
jgi:hypothetical protein